MINKILQINTTLNYGSTGRIVENIGLLSNQEGFETYVIHGPRFINPSQLKSFCTENLIDEKIHGFKSLFFDAHGLGSRTATKNVIKKIDLIKPDIIHLHNIHGYYINYPILFQYLKSINIPIIWTLHDCWSFTGHCAHFDAVGCNKWQERCEKCPNINAYPKSLIDCSTRNYILKKESFLDCNLTLVTVSEWLASLVRKSFLKDYQIKTIHNGVDLNVFKVFSTNIREKLKISENFLILCVASPWTKMKGFEDIIELSRLIDSNTKILVLGVSNTQKKVLPSNIIGIERTDNVQQLAELYNAADLFFNPTYEDNFPTTNLEALACGTPVVTYKTGGSPEAITKETGFVVEQGDYKALIDIINLVKSKGKEYYNYECRVRAMEFFNKDNCFDKYVQMYKELLNK